MENIEKTFDIDNCSEQELSDHLQALYDLCETDLEVSKKIYKISPEICVHLFMTKKILKALADLQDSVNDDIKTLAKKILLVL